MKKVNQLSRFTLSLLTGLMLSHGVQAQSRWPFSLDGQPPRGVFGTDNRLEAKEKWQYRDYVRATASLVRASQIKGEQVYASTLRESLQRAFGKPADPSIRFLDQPIASFCTGFLIAPDLLVTAGHCFSRDGQTFSNLSAPNVGNKSEYVWIFDYTNDVPGGTNGGLRYVNIPKNNQYRIAEIIDASFTGLRGVDMDYAIVRLDRPTDRKPFMYRVGQSVTLDDLLAMVGSPRGLPLKISDSARVTNNDGMYSFLTNLDAFGGNSGGPVFNLNGWIEGILVRGPSKTQTQDFHYDATCDCVKPDVWWDEYSVRRDYGIGGSTYLGNGVFRITALPLQWRKEGVYSNLRYAIERNTPAAFFDWSVYTWIFGKEHRLRDKPDLLLMAAAQGREAIVDTILGIGIANTGLLDLSTKTNDGFSLAHLLVRNSMNDALKKALLLDEFDINALDQNGRTAYFQAVEYNRISMIGNLQRLGAKINQQSNEGETALHMAVRLGNVAAARELLSAGINARLRDRNGKNAYDLAKALKNKELKKLLKAYKK
jgi:hypothetical protein